ncbi:MAG: S-methyl-5-thioribose-1-phosphate isomerase [Gammaproteobacteria bacterium]|uniref:Methylthioribose-1-phosphate isomerase n=1 Tax=Candidatus Thiopontia autotrophica TaxID=2841688 RepID=A0A8J6P9N8_9GAMM|nr:S-methyl-5-thioribose-1-phosphate isomerase [Candidatus Thiopontia autotrophica]MBL6968698.1 S-methyl-5-thioribose-1-phosphate isomerase [Gammaproteobacteria bacterium]
MDRKESPAIQWDGGQLILLDQRILPLQEEYIQYQDVDEVAVAIRDMVVRGAPAIGVTAAYGVVLATKNRLASSGERWRADLDSDLKMLAQARPTAINLHWAIERMRPLLDGDKNTLVQSLTAEAEAIHQEDIDACKTMGGLGAAYINPGSGVLTHCNAGALATGGYGTALGVIRSAWSENRLQAVFADETRPWLQGARLTAWELLQDDIPVSLLADGASSWLMKHGKVDWVVVGSDRIAANGDVANKIGTYATAIAARHHGVKFMVVAPTSTIDRDVVSGDEIPIEVREAEELFSCSGGRMAAQGAAGWNPVFDVTPAELVDVIVTERGVVENPTREKIEALFSA